MGNQDILPETAGARAQSTEEEDLLSRVQIVIEKSAGGAMIVTAAIEAGRNVMEN